MAVNARWTDCPLYIKVKALEEGDPNFEDAWAYFNNLSYVLSMALVGVQFPEKDENDYDTPWAITKDNWEEVFIRLSIWEHLWGALRIVLDDELEGKPISEAKYLDPAEIQGMIGMSVNAGTRCDAEFGVAIYDNLKYKAQRRLRDWVITQEEKTNES